MQRLHINNSGSMVPATVASHLSLVAIEQLVLFVCLFSFQFSINPKISCSLLPKLSLVRNPCQPGFFTDFVTSGGPNYMGVESKAYFDAH